MFTTESIAILPAGLFKPIEISIDKLITAYNNSSLTMKVISDTELEVSELIRELFDLNAMVVFGESNGGAHVIISPINTRHIFTPVEYKQLTDASKMEVNPKQIDELLDKGESGSIDLQTGRVSGVFSKIEAHFKLDIVGLLKLGIKTSGEIVGILLHEIGHVITYMIYCANTASINQVLMLYGKESIDQNTFNRKLSYKLLDEKTVSKQRLDELAKSSNRYIFSWRLSKLLYEHHTAHATYSIYDNTSAESLADNFATRCGYGGELVKALVILSKSSTDKINIIYTDDLSMSSYQIYKRIVSATIPASDIFRDIIAKLIYTANVTAISITHLRTSVLRLFGHEPERPENLLRYDTFNVRVQRIRQQVIAQLSHTRDKKEINKLLTELTSIEADLPSEHIWNNIFGISTYVEKWLNVGEKDQIGVEQSLARIISNPLMVAAAKAAISI